jgi:hypothetical protein
MELWVIKEQVGLVHLFYKKVIPEREALTL